jgi:hypothetical protein
MLGSGDDGPDSVGSQRLRGTLADASAENGVASVQHLDEAGVISAGVRTSLAGRRGDNLAVLGLQDNEGRTVGKVVRHRDAVCGGNGDGY